MHTTVINIFGGPGSGKSVLAARLYADLEVSQIFGTVGHVQEFAKRLVWEENYDALKNQPFVTKGQADLLMPLIGKVSAVVSDSPMELGLIYAEPNQKQKVQNLINICNSKFKRINIFINRADFVFQQTGRIHNHEESRAIDDKIIAMLRANNEPVIEVSHPVDTSEVISLITARIIAAEVKDINTEEQKEGLV